MNKYDELIEELEYIVGRKSDDLVHLKANQEINEKEMKIYQKSVAEINEKLDPDKALQIKKALRREKLYRLFLGALQISLFALVYFTLGDMTSTFAQFLGIIMAVIESTIFIQAMDNSKKESIELKTKQEYFDNMSEDKEFYTKEKDRLQTYINDKKLSNEDIMEQIKQTKEEYLYYQEKLDEVKKLRTKVMGSKQILDVITDLVNQNFFEQSDLIEMEDTLKRERNK